MKKSKNLSIPERTELVRRLEAGEDIKVLARDFNRNIKTIRTIRARITKEGEDWYLKPGKRGPKPGGANPNAGRNPQRKILSSERKRIRAQLESQQTGGGEIGVNLEEFKHLLRDELGFYPLKKTVLALLDEWGMTPRLGSTGLSPKQALDSSPGGEIILKRERRRRKKVNERIKKEGQKELKFYGAPKKGFTGSKMKWRIREVDEKEVCYFLLEVWTANNECRFDEWGKGVCRKELMKMEQHSGIEIMTYVIMDTHCFAVLRFAAREKWLERFSVGSKSENEEAILTHAKLRFNDDYNNIIPKKAKQLSGADRVNFFEDLKNSFCDLSLSVKLFKEAVTRVMNEHAGRAGPFWEERFGSKRLHTPEDLVKAGLRVDGWAHAQGLLIDEPPESYPWCGFSEAVGGSKRFRKGLCRIMGIPMDRWKVRTKIEGFGSKGLPRNLYRKRLMQGRDQ